MVRHYKTGEWTDDRFALAEKLWVAGLSATQIAATLGGVSRNAVLGKLHRAGLLARAKPATPAKVKTFAPPVAKLSSVRHANNGRIYPQPPAIPLPPSRPIDVMSAKPWIERAFGECAFPVGGEGDHTLSCCGRVKGDTQYCAAHHEIMYAPRAPSKVKSEKRWINQLAQNFAA